MIKISHRLRKLYKLKICAIREICGKIYLEAINQSIQSFRKDFLRR